MKTQNNPADTLYNVGVILEFHVVCREGQAVPAVKVYLMECGNKMSI